MSWLRKLFGSGEAKDVFTPEAKEFWESMPEKERTQIINCVWCVSCKKPTGVPMVNYSGEMEGKDLILTGRCGHCGCKVTRLIEGE